MQNKLNFTMINHSDFIKANKYYIKISQKYEENQWVIQYKIKYKNKSLEF